MENFQNSICSFLKRFLPVAIVIVVLFGISVQAFAWNAGDACTTAGKNYFSEPKDSGALALICDGSVLQVYLNSDVNPTRVGIATDTPKVTLDVNGEVKVGNTGIACSGLTMGALRYNSGIQYCNGTLWINVTPSCVSTSQPYSFTNQTGLATSTLITSNIAGINGTDPSCNSTVSVTGLGSPEFRICSDAACSTVVQNWSATTTAIDMNARYMQVRATTATVASTTYTITASVGVTTALWTISTNSIGSCGNIKPGDEGMVCADGSIYAGVSPDMNVNMYVMPCDLGMSVVDGVCTGMRSFYTWNNGTEDWVITGVTSYTTGRINTKNLVALNDIGSPYAAAVACNSQTFGGHNDWYLPAKNELDIIYTTLCGGVVQNGFFTDYYWSSSEYYNAGSWTERFDTGFQYDDGKYNSHVVRCVRR